MKHLPLTIALAALAASTLACTCNSGPRTTRTSEMPEAVLSGPETWTIDGEDYAIEGTGVILFHDRPLYVIRYLCGSCLDDVQALPESEREARAREAVWALVKKAYEDDRLAEAATHVHRVGGEVRLEDVIGVAIIAREDGALAGVAVSEAYGYRVQWTVADIQARLGRAPTP